MTLEERKKIVSVAFTRIESLQDVAKIDNECDQKNVLNAQECFFLKNLHGYNPAWKEVYLNYSTMTSLRGLKQGLEILHANGCKNLNYPVGLPSSCKEASFAGSKIIALQKPYLSKNAKASIVFEPMTEGLEEVSFAGCGLLTSLKGLCASCKKISLRETDVKSFDNAPKKGLEEIDATWCKHLTTTRNLPSTVKVLDLSYSGIRTLEDIPTSIQCIKVYSCSHFDKKCLSNLPPRILPRIMGLDGLAQEYANSLYNAWAKEQKKRTIRTQAMQNVRA